MTGDDHPPARRAGAEGEGEMSEPEFSWRAIVLFVLAMIAAVSPNNRGNVSDPGRFRCS